MAKIRPYLNFNGNAEEAFSFYKSAFGSDFSMLQRFKEMPDSENLPPEVQEKILHVSLPVGEDAILMGSDTLESFGGKAVPGSNFSLSLDVESREEADRLFGLLSEGGEVIMPQQEMFWGSYFGMLQDRFGIRWMIGHSPEGT
jgi:PhnB protein